MWKLQDGREAEDDSGAEDDDEDEEAKEEETAAREANRCRAARRFPALGRFAEMMLAAEAMMVYEEWKRCGAVTGVHLGLQNASGPKGGKCSSGVGLSEVDPFFEKERGALPPRDNVVANTKVVGEVDKDTGYLSHFC